MWKSIHMYLYICLPAWCCGPNYSLIPCMKYRVQIMINHYSDKINIQNRKIQEFYKYKMTSKSSQSSHVLLKTWNVLIYWSLRLQVKKSSTFFFPLSHVCYFPAWIPTSDFTFYILINHSQSHSWWTVHLELFLYVKILKVSSAFHMTNRYVKGQLKWKSKIWM